MRPRISLLATGGTIASLVSSNGLAPAMPARELLARMPALMTDYDVRVHDVFTLDSSNIQPEEWQELARAVRGEAAQADGLVITHGTDTMAYTASALSFMLLGLGKPVVLTGSQLPLGHPLSDAPHNLAQAFAVARQAPPGVYIAFQHKVIHGTRAVKMRTLGYDAFDSINAPAVGFFDADGLHLSPVSDAAVHVPGQSPPENLDARVFLLKLVPGTDPSVFQYVADAGYRGLVLEAFGLGGLHYIRRNLLDSLALVAGKGVLTLVTTQCLYEKADFSVYEVGRNILGENIYGAHDMTSEAALTKLMWVLGDPARRPLLTQCLSHEMGSV